MTESAEQLMERMFQAKEQVNEQEKSQGLMSLQQTDPEFMERFASFAYDEVVNESGKGLDERDRMMAILAALIGCQGIDLFKEMVPAAMNLNVTPIEVKEIVYQAVDYLGMGRVYPFIKAVNQIFEQRNISLPLEGQATTTMDNRLQAGVRTQVEIFGERMEHFFESGPEESKHINRWLAANCFGDYYTRKGLNLKQREMVTFCYIAAQGGCEPQLTSHAAANLRLGNDKQFLINVISQCVPYLGYPRSLNALRCVNDAAESLGL